MEIGDWAATRDLNAIYGQIRALGLEANLAELEAFGFTVIEGALSPDLTRRLRGAVLTWRTRPSLRRSSSPPTSSSRTRCSRKRCLTPSRWR
jgi:hypothetical protein